MTYFPTLGANATRSPTLKIITGGHSAPPLAEFNSWRSRHSTEGSLKSLIVSQRRRHQLSASQNAIVVEEARK